MVRRRHQAAHDRLVHVQVLLQSAEAQPDILEPLLDCVPGGLGEPRLIGVGGANCRVLSGEDDDLVRGFGLGLGGSPEGFGLAGDRPTPFH